MFKVSGFKFLYNFEPSVLEHGTWNLERET